MNNNLYEQYYDLDYNTWFDDVPGNIECMDPYNDWCNGDCAHCSSAYEDIDWNDYI